MTKLIIEKLVKKNFNRLVIPTDKVRDFMKDYRKFTFNSQKNLSKLFYDLELNNKFNEDEDS